MGALLKSLGIDRLSVEERLTLVEDLWDSIADENAAAPLTDAQRAELDRRPAHCRREAGCHQARGRRPRLVSPGPAARK